MIILLPSRGWSLAFTLVVLGVAACSSATGATGSPPAAAKCKADAECAGSAGKPLCDVASGACLALPPGNEIGYRDGSAASVAFTEVYATGAAAQPVDLTFHSDRTDELWVVGYGDDSIHVGSAIGSDGAAWKRILDPAARHFMHKPPALAMGTAERFGTCGDNDNSQNSGGADGSATLFMGPSLFSTDLTVLGKKTAGGLGSHEDMLHNTPLCRGIAHVSANTFWVFNAYDRSLDKYKFNTDHGPGNDDHSDGEIYRYAAGKVKGADDTTPSHVFFDADDGFLYVADTGNARVVRLDTTKGTKGASLERQMEPLKDDGMMNGTDVEVVVAAGTLTKPSGLEIHAGLVYVTDAADSTFHVFDKAGAPVRSLATDLPAGSLAGFTFGPDGKIYFTDKVGGRVMRIDPR